MSEKIAASDEFAHAPLKNVAMCWQAPPHVMRAFFSGADPEVGAGYVFRVDEVSTMPDGRVSVSLNFVPAR